MPLNRYRTFRRGKAAERVDRIHAMARQLNIPISALSGSDLRVVSDDSQQRIDELPHQPFDARKFEYHFPGVIAAKLAIADELAILRLHIGEPAASILSRSSSVRAGSS